MFFKKKDKKENLECPNCRSGIEKKFSFCPYCGHVLADEEKMRRDFGMLGKGDAEEEIMRSSLAASNMGMADKLIGSLVSSLMKNIDMQMKDIEKTEVNSYPTGIKIKIGGAPQKKHHTKLVNRPLTENQLSRMADLPRVEAKAQLKRLSDKVLYELGVSGVQSVDDVLISKLESGYEVKAISKNKVYVNSIPIDLPLRGFTLKEKGLIVEFSASN